MTKKTVILAFIIFFSLNSCERILENHLDQQAQENYTSPYKGVWVGNYSGNTNGNLKIEIYKSGNVQVTRIDNNFSEIFFGTILDNGAFLNTISQNSSFEILGNLQSQNNQANGTWKLNNNSGNWQLTKQ